MLSQPQMSPLQIHTHGYAAQKPKDHLAPFSFERRALLPRDVQLEIQYCGICHSDIHQVRNEWNMGLYPMVPGHEIVGRVIDVGSKVTKFRVGDVAGVGCMVDSCRTCEPCKRGEEQFCEKGPTWTYASEDKVSGGITYGGYSDKIVVDQDFTLRISPKADLAATAPLLCAGITTYSPMRRWQAGPGRKVGVIGLGGLGHMGLKFARSFGAHVVQFTTSPGKEQDAKRLGADEVVISKNTDEMRRHTNSFDFILDTVSALHNVNDYLSLLKNDGTLTMVGMPGVDLPVTTAILTFGRRRLAGSAIGGIRETQEMLDYCAEKRIAADIEKISIQNVNEAYERVIKSNVKYRFVIDMASLKNA